MNYQYTILKMSYHNFLEVCLVLLLLVVVTFQEEARRRSQSTVTSRPCKAKYINASDTFRIVCECTIDYCDNLVFDWPKPGELLQVTTSEAGKRFELKYNKPDCERTSSRVTIDRHVGNKLFGRISDEDENNIDISDENNRYVLKISLTKRYQEIIGFGGAFTDAAVLNMDSLPNQMKDVIIDNYFGGEGLHYSIARVPIAGSDFSTHAYSYDDTENTQDLLLSEWKLTDEDTKYKIPYLKKAINLFKNRTQKDLKIFASPWSPPRWMKNNNHFARGFLRGTSGPEGLIYRSYADYLIKFLDAYKQNGIELWGMTVQNEPGMSYLPIYMFNSLQFPSGDQINFIKYHLGPRLLQHGYTKDKFKLIIGDDSIGIVNHQVGKIMKDKSARSYVSGLATHWYMNNYLSLELINKLYNNYKNQVEFILSTEACNGWLPSDVAIVMGDWKRGINYFNDIVDTLNRNVNGWVDWNLVLDTKGGPNWSGNFVDSPILVDSENQKFYKNPMFYILGHFSRFIPPGSRRVANKLSYNGASGIWSIVGRLSNKKLKMATFVTPSNHLIIVIANLSKVQQTISVKTISDREDFVVEIDGHCVTTIAYGL